MTEKLYTGSYSSKKDDFICLQFECESFIVFVG